MRGACISSETGALAVPSLTIPSMTWGRARDPCLEPLLEKRRLSVSTARLAQSAERKALNLVVVGSSPTVGVFAPGYVVDSAGNCEQRRNSLSSALSEFLAVSWAAFSLPCHFLF